MGLRILNPDEVKRMMELAENTYRPPQILKLKEEIEGEIRVEELRASISGVINPKHIEKIVAMKIELDTLYALWIDGKI